MHVDDRLVRHIASLARIALSDDEVRHLVPQMAAILDYVERVSTLPGARAGRADPEGSDLGGAIDLADLRDDVPGPTLDLPRLLRQAPAGDGSFFVVPRFLADGDAEPA